MAKAIMFLGTGRDVGKSIAATAFCRIFKRRGYKVAPFKAITRRAKEQVKLVHYVPSPIFFCSSEPRTVSADLRRFCR
jgi:dethiobiotin synthetase